MPIMYTSTLSYEDTYVYSGIIRGPIPVPRRYWYIVMHSCACVCACMYSMCVDIE